MAEGGIELGVPRIVGTPLDPKTLLGLDPALVELPAPVLLLTRLEPVVDGPMVMDEGIPELVWVLRLDDPPALVVAYVEKILDDREAGDSVDALTMVDESCCVVFELGKDTTEVDDAAVEGMSVGETSADDTLVVEVSVVTDDGGIEENKAVAPRETPDANGVCFAPSPFKGLKPPW